MEEIIFNETLMQHFERQNTMGLAELLLFGEETERYFDNFGQRNRALRHVVAALQEKKQKSPYDVPAKDFAKLITYDTFKERRGISQAVALGLRLYLLHQCGVDWLNPGKLVIGF